MADTAKDLNDQSNEPPDAEETGVRPQRRHLLLWLARLACIGVYEVFLGIFFTMPYFWRVRRRILRILRYLREEGGDPAEEALALREKRYAEWGIALGLVVLASAVVSLVSAMVCLFS